MSAYKVPAKSRQTKSRTLPTIVRWLRTAGGAAELLGWGGLILGNLFWTGATSIYSGFALLALDVWFEPGFNARWKPKLLLWTMIAIIAGVFSWGFVFVDAPLPVTPIPSAGEYPPGTVISGIPWKPEFDELDIDFENPKSQTYDGFDVVIRPSSPVIAIAQMSNIPGVYFEDKNGLLTHIADRTPKNIKAIPLIVLATDAGYRVRVDRFPANSHLRIVMALAEVKWPPSLTFTPTIPINEDRLVNDPNFVLKIREDDFSTYWLGHKDGDVLAPHPLSRTPFSGSIKVEGGYMFRYRWRTVSRMVHVG